jgi:hypothetical protein
MASSSCGGRRARHVDRTDRGDIVMRHARDRSNRSRLASTQTLTDRMIRPLVGLRPRAADRDDYVQGKRNDR